MQLAGIPVLDMAQFLSNPSWGGIGVIVSSALSITAILLSLQPHLKFPQKKI